MRQTRNQKLVLTALLTAIAVVGGNLFEFPIGPARVAPTQHLINLISGVLVGPYYAVAQAFLTSLLRNMLGTGTLLAFPGSMIGALCVGYCYRWFKNLLAAALGELIGTGILGALVAYPLAALFLGTTGALWVFIPSFFLSALVGVIVGYIILRALWPVLKARFAR
ncbi:energy coupling factor transporter S component ThiW [Loigolactobacillus backii]|uniref:Energy coupling factor transporter S component ThiW n=1 Tax=Loigolactobacillus backii TaxID=375175 RepID=A0A192H4J2_9LACO|nr:energy coupling factor transporter S component ThiW [Loigolactobacillus backii]ANK59542.1 energy coupling factor transporter S component ThiW [Loigolactobacillus backii]ANK62896.1 energy coupling factor transporter S component ThiW [Loigolactobacillus backii]ANK64536.1 energy coupling factor transporter S component ThiW [Loigolactobacillus backii]ANK67068.1 energy coupling factor transporter S component ThiW [Loigolactobacillus backii]ANK70096.1 energy coupling factor transporter S componen